MASYELEMAWDREWNATWDLELADEEWYAASDELWEAQFQVDNHRTNEEYMLAVPRLEAAEERMQAADDWWYAAYDEVNDAWNNLYDAEWAFEEAEEAMWEYYDVYYSEDFEYVDYDEWEAPDDYDLYFDYGYEDCDEDDMQYDCEEECSDDPSLDFCASP